MSKAKLVAYKVSPEELLDLIDAAALGDRHALLKRCPGGRLISDGYMCPHCGEDPTIVYDAKGKEAHVRKPGEKYHRKCGSPTAKVLRETDLTSLFPIHIEG